MAKNSSNNALGIVHRYFPGVRVVEDHRPDIAQAISDKAFELFPSRRKPNPVDLTFLDERTVSPKRTRNHV